MSVRGSEAVPVGRRALPFWGSPGTDVSAQLIVNAGGVEAMLSLMEHPTEAMQVCLCTCPLPASLAPFHPSPLYPPLACHAHRFCVPTTQEQASGTLWNLAVDPQNKAIISCR